MVMKHLSIATVITSCSIETPTIMKISWSNYFLLHSCWCQLNISVFFLLPRGSLDSIRIVLRLRLDFDANCVFLAQRNDLSQSNDLELITFICHQPIKSRHGVLIACAKRKTIVRNENDSLSLGELDQVCVRESICSSWRTHLPLPLKQKSHLLCANCGISSAVCAQTRSLLSISFIFYLLHIYTFLFLSADARAADN